MALTPRSVFRPYETDGVPSSGPHKPKKSEIIQLLEQIFGSSRGGWVVVETLADLEAVTPSSETDGGRVLTGDGAGDYYREGGEWVFGRGLPDTVARLTDVAGTNDITGTTLPGVNPASVLLFNLNPVAANTGSVRVNIDSAGLVPLNDYDGTPIAAGVLLAGKPVLFFDNGDSTYRLWDTTLSAREVALQAKADAVAAAEASGDVVFFDTKADATAALGGLAEGQVVRVFADESNDGAQVFYRVESAALVVKVNTDGRTADVLGEVLPSLHGATGDGVVLDDDALAAAIAEAYSRASLIVTSGGVATERALVSGAGREYRVSRPIILPSGGGVTLSDMRIIVDDDFEPVGGEPAYVFVMGEGEVLDADDAHHIKHADIVFENCTLDGRHVGSVGGIYATNVWGMTIRGNCLYHFSGPAITVDSESRTVTSHEYLVAGNYIREWTESEPPDPVLGDGFHDATLRVGTGIRLNAPDGIIANNDVGFCKFPLDQDYGGNRFVGNHWYGGSIDITHPLDDAGTRFGASATSFTGDFFDNHTSLTVHNPLDVTFDATCLFFSVLAGGGATAERWFVTVDLDSTNEPSFANYQINLDGIFFAPAATFGRVAPFRLVTTATGPNGHALVGRADGLFRNVPSERWAGIYSSTVSRRDLTNRVAGEVIETRWRDGNTTKWAVRKTAANEWELRNEATGAVAFSTDTVDTVMNVPRLRHSGSVLAFFNQAGVTGQPSGSDQAFISDPTQQQMTNNTGGDAATTLSPIVAGTDYFQADMEAVKLAINSLHARLNEVRVDVAAVTTLTKAIRSALMALGLMKGGA